MSADQNKSMKNFPAYIDFTHYHLETPFNTFANRAEPEFAALVRAAWPGSTLFAYRHMIYLI